MSSPSNIQELILTAKSLVYPRGRGIYATDESPEAIEAILSASDKHETSSDQTDHEMKLRHLSWRAAAYESVSNENISGVILHPDTLLNSDLSSILKKKGISVGVRANGELQTLPSSPEEYLVQGLDDLLPKLQLAYAAGAKFSKWRIPVACTSPGRGMPTQVALELHAEILAVFASLSQQAGLVPIVEPDVEFSADADLQRSVDVHQKVLRMIYSKCIDHGVVLEATLVKPSFPQPGLQHPSRETISTREIAEATLAVISNSVPTSVTGVVFLSGGLVPQVAVGYLAAVNALVNASPADSAYSRLPPLSFSYGRAIQGDALGKWLIGDYSAMKSCFDTITRACSQAAKGETAHI